MKEWKNVRYCSVREQYSWMMNDEWWMMNDEYLSRLEKRTESKEQEQDEIEWE
jgi:hypothetical protein